MSRYGDRKGFRVTFSVPEIGEALNQISAYDGKAATRIENVIQNSAQNIREGAKRRVRVKSGKLQKRISSRFIRNTVTGYVAAKAPHAHLIEFGAKATTTTPKDKKALTVPQNREIIVVKKARIPKRQEYPYMRPAFEDEKPNLVRGLKEAVKP